MAYNYIAKTYGKTFKPGDRVSFSEYHGLLGTVRRAAGDPQYVSVKFDNGRSGDCHPDSLTIIDTP